MKENFFIEAKVKKIDKDIEKAIKKSGIVYPHPSLAFFKAVYAKLEEPNRNKVMLAQNVENDIPQLIGCQMNRDHRRYGSIMGQILHAYLNKENEIEIIFSFHKSVYSEEYKECLELMSKDKLTVSFELKVDKENVEYLSSGVRRLTKVDFDGVGLLMGVTPAYPNAYVFETAKRVVKDVIGQDSEELIYAKQMAEDCKSILKEIEKSIEGKSLSLYKDANKENNQMDKKANDALLAELKKLYAVEFGEDVIKDWSDADFENTEKIEALRESLKPVEETKEVAEEVKEEEVVEEGSYDCECLNCGKILSSEEHCKDIKCPECGGEMRRKDRPSKNASEEVEEVVPVEEVKEEVVEEVKEEEVEEAQKMKVEVETVQKVTDEIDDEAMTESVKVEVEQVKKVDDVVKETVKTVEERVYNYAEVEAIKADYESKLKEQTDELAKKEEDIAFYKENAQKVVVIRAEMGDFVKDLSDQDLFDETKMKIAKLEKENAELRANKVEVASDEKSEEVKVEENLDTGHKEVEVKDEETSKDRIQELVKKRYIK